MKTFDECCDVIQGLSNFAIMHNMLECDCYQVANVIEEEIDEKLQIYY